jgi:hypothetical protein
LAHSRTAATAAGASHSTTAASSPFFAFSHVSPENDGVKRASAQTNVHARGRRSVLLEWLFSFDAEGLS